MDTSKEAVAAVQDAIHVITQRGWCQNAFEGPMGEVCLSRALRVNQTSRAAQVAARGALVKVLQEQYPGHDLEPATWDEPHALGATIIVYNDQVLQSQGEALAVLEKTAARLEESV